MSAKSNLALQARVTCPHCWHSFAPETVLWISQHPDLLGDVRLGPDRPQRFLPTRFTVEGDAIDPKGVVCHELACPKCHLGLPRSLLELEPLFVSILGTPASGKSYFLASMTWQLRQVLPKYFAMSFGDADPTLNRILNEYEEQQFLSPDQDKLVAIRKTELQGELYDTVLFGDQTVSYPRPFVFGLRLSEQHPNFKQGAQCSRVLCMYDNAGEHFLPGADTSSSPVTRHLASSRILFYLLDPTQDPRVRRACGENAHDPQMRDRARTLRQETVLLEAAERVRRFARLPQNAKHTRPLVVVVTKYDAWSNLLPLDELQRSPWITSKNQGIAAADLSVVDRVSARLRTLLLEHMPEVVSAAEGFAQNVVYVPVSATGCSPEVDPETGMLGLRPKDIRPQWVEVPIVYAMSRWLSGLIPHLRVRAPSDGTEPPASVKFPRLRESG